MSMLTDILTLLTREQASVINAIVEEAILKTENNRRPSINFTNCPNCGAVITSNHCEYCGTVFCKGE